MMSTYLLLDYIKIISLNYVKIRVIFNPFYKKKLICLVYAVHWKKKFIFDCVIVLDYDT